MPYGSPPRTMPRVTFISLICTLVLSVAPTLGAGPVTPSPHWRHTINFPADSFRRNSPTDGTGWVKFAILTCDPQTVYFQNSNTYLFHHDFATALLDPFVGFTLEQFNAVSQFAAGQEVILGTVILPETSGGFIQEPKFQEYGIQFVRRDAYTPQEIVDLFALVASKVSAGPAVQPYYFPAYEQQQVADQNSAFLAARGVPVSSLSRWSQGNACYSQGWAIGRLKFVPAGQIESAFLAGALSPDDILLTDGVPAEIPTLAGVLTLAPSTPNSHVAILANTYHAPFAHLALAEDVTQAESLIGRRIVLRSYLRHNVCELRLIDIEDELTTQQIDDIAALNAPPILNIAPIAPAGGYSSSTEVLAPSDIAQFGGKASNFGLLRRAIPARSPVAAALSFDVWNEFLDQSLAGGQTLRQYINAKLAGHTWPPNFDALADDLDDIRDLIKDEDETHFSPALQSAILAVLTDPQYLFDPDLKIRFRSSTNVEDSETYTGAGLYDSESGCLRDDLDGDNVGPSACDAAESSERGVFRAIRRVFDSFYHDNAYIERLRHGVDESQVGMAVLIHHSFPDELELANGVATLTRDAQGTNVLLVTQQGAVSVTNPTSGVIPEEVSVFVQSGGTQFPAFIRPSNLVPIGARVMTWTTDYTELTTLLLAVADQFELETGKTEYILDFEYKKVSPGGGALPIGGLVVKQVREIPRADTTATITPFLVNEPLDLVARSGRPSYFGGNGTIHLKTHNMWLDGATLAQQSIIAEFAGDLTDGCNAVRIFGAMESLPSATHLYDAALHRMTDSWQLGQSPNRRTQRLRIDNVGAPVSAAECPVVTLRDLGVTSNGVMLQTIELETPLPGGAPFGDPVSVVIGTLTPVDTPPDDVVDAVRSYMSDDGRVIIDTFFRTLVPSTTICCFATELAAMDETIIYGLTSEPIVLTSPAAHTWSSGQHNWTESAQFEPFAQHGLSPRQWDELAASGVRLIDVFTDHIGGDGTQVTFYSDAELGLTCAACGALRVGDLNGDGALTAADATGFAAALLDAPNGPRETCAADINNSGAVDGDDVAAFVSTLLAG